MQTGWSIHRIAQGQNLRLLTVTEILRCNRALWGGITAKPARRYPVIAGEDDSMKILLIDGNPKQGGFSESALRIASSRLEKMGASTETIRLVDTDIKDCIGCSTCLKTGKCVLRDDAESIIQSMKESDGFVIAGPVRNSLVTACFKRFYERITYTLGFPLLLEDKYTLAVSSVGYMGGKSVCRRFYGLQGEFHTYLSGFIFCAVGIPPTINPEDIQERLEKAADKLMADIGNRTARSLFQRVSFFIDRLVMRKFMFNRRPDVYAHVIQCWKAKGYMTDR
jgi:multimeric flavodoxin WrbA